MSPLRLFAAIAWLVTFASSAPAFVFIESFPPWPDGTVTLELQLGNSPTYSDGTTPNSTAIQAIAQWNPSMDRVQLDYVNNSPAARSKTNGKNNVFFDSKIYGSDFPDGVLAVTLGRVDTAKPIEMDVVVNNARQWDSYRGYLQHPKIDLRRVLAHEFGHVLGLGHPDERGQWISALMNSHVSSIDETQQDDKDGASSLYGHGPGNPAVAPTFYPHEPYDATVLEGSPVSFYAYVTGTQPIALQWLKDGQPIAGATGGSYSIQTALLTDSGRYSLRATNAGGSTTSREATLVVQKVQPPTIINHPRSVTVEVSSSLDLSVWATSNSSIAVQWTKDDVPIPGATWYSYSRTSVLESDAGSYRAVVSTAGGSVTSEPATVTVIPAKPPIFTQHPSTVTIEEGASTDLYAYATSTVPATYQWTKDGVAISGANSSYLSLYKVRTSDAGSYRLVVTNAGGSVSSNAATITVTATRPPSITEHPLGGTVEVGGSFQLTSYARSAVPMTYRWLKNNAPIAGANDNWLRLTNILEADAGDYQFVATNAAGNATSNVATLKVIPTRPPVITSHPFGGTYEAGSSFFISASVQSTVQVSLQWTRDDVPIPGAIHPSLHLVITEDQAGIYRLVATNSAGVTTSNPATVTVTPARPPRFTSHPVSATVEIGGQFSIYANAMSVSSVSYQWTRNGVDIPGAFSSHYSIQTAAQDHAGDYALRATNAAGVTTSNTATITVVPTRPPVITRQPQSSTHQVGTYASLWSEYMSAVQVTVQWSKDGVALPGSNSTYMNLPAITEASAGSYVMTVTNSAGSASSDPAVITVIPAQPPRFISHPTGGVSEVGGYRWFSASIESATPATVQWTRDGVAIQGAGYGHLSLNNIAMSDAGVYRAVATNQAGSTNSNTATLKVIPLRPPTFLIHPASTTVELGSGLYLDGEAASAVPITFQWLHNGTPLAPASQRALNVQAVSADHAGTYELVATNPAGSTTSRTATVTVIEAKAPEIIHHPADTTVEEGEWVMLGAEIRSALPATVQWYRDNEALAGSGYSHISFGPAVQAHAGNYTLVATNAAGSATSSSATVTVMPPGPPRIADQPLGRYAVVGQRAGFTVSARSASPVTIEWYKNGSALPQATSSDLNLDPVSESDAGSYHAVLTNQHGATTSDTAELVVIPPPLPEPTRLANRHFSSGVQAQLMAWQPTDRGLCTFQWYRDGVALPGQEHHVLNFNPAQVTDSGEYFATVTNAAGTVTTTAAHVTVWPRATEGTSFWTDMARVGDALFFQNPALNRIDRFDLATDAEQPSVHVRNTPTALAADATHLYVASGPEVIRMRHDGTGTTPFASVTGNVVRMAVAGEHLFCLVVADTDSLINQIMTVDLADGRTRGLSPSMGNVSRSLAVDPASGRTFAAVLSGSYGSPALGVVTLSVDASGTFGPVESTPANFDYPVGDHLALFPGGQWILDFAGTVYQTTDLTPVGSLGLPVDSVDFLPDGGLAALRHSHLSIYDDALNFTRKIRLAKQARFIVLDDGDAVAFSLAEGSGSIIAQERHPLHVVDAKATEPAVIPSALSFVPDAVETDRDGNILLLSRRHQAVFRWNVREQRYTATIPVPGFPNHLACARTTNTVFLGYADRSVVSIELDGDATARSIGAVSWDIVHFVATDRHLAITANGAARSLLILLGRQGEMLDLTSMTSEPFELAWSTGDSRLYHLTTDSHDPALFYRNVSGEGTFAPPSTVRQSVRPSESPLLRISPDARRIALHHGQVMDIDPQDGTVRAIPPFADSAWLSQTMIVGGDDLTGIHLRRLGAELEIERETKLSGRLLRLLPAGPDRLVALTVKHGRLLFSLLDDTLAVRTHYTERREDESRVANLSVRADVGTGDGIVVVGFVVTGEQSKRMLVRAAGPALLPFGVPDALADPFLDLVTLAGAPIQTNDDWSTLDAPELRKAFQQAGAFTFADGSRDSAMIVDLTPGQYTAKVSGNGGTTGVVLVETYDLDPASPSRRLVNSSSRAFVGRGDKVLIPGLVIEGPDPKRILVRAVGPTLAQYGVTGELADPRLVVVDGNHQVLFSNDDWTADNADVITATAATAGAFPLPNPSRDAALAITLSPGAYTIGVSGAADTTGIALVEVYEVP